MIKWVSLGIIILLRFLFIQFYIFPSPVTFTSSIHCKESCRELVRFLTTYFSFWKPWSFDADEMNMMVMYHLYWVWFWNKTCQSKTLGAISEVYGHDGPGVCLGDDQTEAEGVPSQGGRGDALLRRMPPYLTCESNVKNLDWLVFVGVTLTTCHGTIKISHNKTRFFVNHRVRWWRNR